MKKIMLAAAAAALMTATAPAMAQDAAAGEKLAKRCIACHSFDEGGRNKVGPNLYDVAYQAPASAEGFRYSKGITAAAEAGFEWTDETLDAYLADPTKFVREVSGNDKARSKMTYKLTKEGDRADMIAYLKTLGEPTDGAEADAEAETDN